MSDKLSRRTLLKWLSIAPVAASFPLLTQAQSISTSAKIVIIGSGMGGLSIANRLANRINNPNITIIDKRTEHNYQAGYTLVGSGIWTKDKIINQNIDFIPSSAKWIQEAVIAIDPDNNQVTTESGKKIDYDFLVVATGLVLDYHRIEGMDVKAIGQNGLTSVYNGVAAAVASWNALEKFRTTGGKAVMNMPETSMKCAGAPLKMTFMVNDRLTKAGSRGNTDLQFYSAMDYVFNVPSINKNILERWKQLNIPVNFHHQLTSIDIQARRATFQTIDNQLFTTDYDFIHVVPPMSAPDCVKNSPLASQEKPYASGGWLAVSKDTLQHLKYPNVFGIGDINGTPRGKTAATVKKSSPIVAENLLSVIQGKQPQLVFDGYTSCPLLIREGSALLIEFDYEGRLTPSIPGVEPLQDSYLAWIMKTEFLKPAYLAVLKGRV